MTSKFKVLPKKRGEMEFKMQINESNTFCIPVKTLKIYISCSFLINRGCQIDCFLSRRMLFCLL